MLLTTLCYIEKDDAWLMLHRVSKKNDINKDKWIGVGGKFLPGESPEDCLLREVREETGCELQEWEFRGILTFLSDQMEPEYICLYTGRGLQGSLQECDEGVLEWVRKSDVPALNLWTGDRIFLRLLEERREFFSMKLCYTGDHLDACILDGQPMTQEEIETVAAESFRTEDRRPS